MLRGEWAGAEAVPDSALDVFQGRGAAHPHWHLAGAEDPSSFDPGSWLGPDPADNGPHPFGDPVMSEQDPVLVHGTFLEPGRGRRAVEPAWAGVHLAASAKWADEPWQGPGGPDHMHASNPADCEQIRHWITSCVRYLKSELEGQFRRGRR